MCFRDYVFSFLLFGLMVFILFSIELNHARQIGDLKDEMTSFRQTVTASQESILVNVKKPVWWR